ncbi:MAG: hypothetical protein M3Y06_01150, partial [Actinomycetota bacterium]|nr:hypothetical protein [Actinomycetota bacterium]
MPIDITQPVQDIEFQTIGQLVMPSDLAAMRSADRLLLAKFLVAMQGVTSAIPAYSGMQLHTNGTFNVQPGIAGEWVMLEATFCDSLGSNAPIPVNPPSAALRVDAVYVQPTGPIASSNTQSREVEAGDGTKAPQTIPLDTWPIGVQYVAGAADGSGTIPGPPASGGPWVLFASISVAPTCTGITAANVTVALPPMSPQGPRGLQGFAGPAPIVRGVWSAATAYNVLDIVVYSGTGYIASQANINVEPDTDNGVHWTVIGAKGNPGNPGNPGLSLTLAGAWSGATPYAINEVVSFGGALYGAIAPSTNAEPDTNPTKWVLLIPQGAKGDQGNPGNPGPTGPAFNVRGAWNGATAYAVNDVVLDGAAGGSYVAVAASTNVQPSTDNGTHWVQWSQRGGPGPQGNPGNPGASITGPQGAPAWTTTTAPAIIPAVGAGVAVAVQSNTQFPQGTYVLVSDGANGFAGKVTSVGAGSITVNNRGVVLGAVGNQINTGATVTFSGVSIFAPAPAIAAVVGGSGSVSLTLPAG